MPSEEQKAELKQKIGDLITTRFGGDDAAAFRDYADSVGLIDRTSLKNLLCDAGVGNSLTRGAWADGILAAVDTDRDRKISWAEFVSVFRD